VNYTEDRLGIIATTTIVSAGIKGLSWMIKRHREFGERMLQAAFEKDVEEFRKKIAELDKQIEAYGVQISEINDLTVAQIAEYERKKANQNKEKSTIIIGGAAALVAGLLLAS